MIINFAKMLSLERCANLLDLKKMLQHEDTLAKLGPDTAENEPSKGISYIFSSDSPRF